MAWTIQFCRVVATQHVLASFVPGHQLCRVLSDPIHMWPVRGYRHVVVPAAAVEAFDEDDRDEGDSDAGEPKPPDPDEGGGDGGVGADELEESGGDDDDDDDGGAADGPTGPRSKALVSAAVPGGRIVYYRDGTF